MQRFNTFKAHQLLAWAKAKGNQTALKLALFKAYFTDHKDISNEFELALIAKHIGFNKTEVLNALQSKQYEQPVRNAQNHWISQGINSVPSSILQKISHPRCPRQQFMARDYQQYSCRQPVIHLIKIKATT